MARILFALVATAGFAGLANAQQNNLPLSPGVRPVPVMPAGIGPTTTRPGQPGIIYFPAIAPWGWATGWGYQSSYSPWSGYGYTFGGYLPNGTVAPVQDVTVERTQKPEPRVVLANEFPATLSLQFPAAAEVWLNGEKVKGEAQESRALTSPVLRPGTQYTFEVKARWTSRGKLYESVRTVTLGPGDRSRLLVVSGTEVRE